MLETIREQIAELMRCGMENDPTLCDCTSDDLAADIMAYSDYFWEIAPDAFQNIPTMDEQRMALGNIVADIRVTAHREGRKP